MRDTIHATLPQAQHPGFSVTVLIVPCLLDECCCVTMAAMSEWPGVTQGPEPVCVPGCQHDTCWALSSCQEESLILMNWEQISSVNALTQSSYPFETVYVARPQRVFHSHACSACKGGHINDVEDMTELKMCKVCKTQLLK